jgi:hypothetical protein
MSKKAFDILDKIRKNNPANEHSADAFTYALSYLTDDEWDSDTDDDLDFGTFDNSIGFEDLLDLLDLDQLDKLNTDYDFSNGRSTDKTFENENKINTKPNNPCKHEMEKKFLISSFYFKCKKCNYEEG